MRHNNKHTDKAGQRFGRLVAIERVHDHDLQSKHAVWLCRCDCGASKLISSNALRHDGGVRSCGCLVREAAAHRAKSSPPWNAGITYARGDVAEYSTKHGWTKAVIRVKGNRCENCGWDRAKCDVHHILPKSRGGKNTIDNARVLCPNCHREHHHA